jgi:predicted O-methyltransferase YrrM
MAHGPIFFTPELYEYYKSIGYREPTPLAALRLHFQDHPQAHQQTMPESAQLLSFLVALTRPQHILEIGTFIGYSTLAMALAMGTACRLTTCDLNAELAAQAQVFWQKSGHGSQITFLPGPAQDTLNQMIARQEVADFIYIDANKAGYDDYYEAALQLAPLHGLILLDNTLFGGHVIHPHPPSYVQAIQRLNRKIHADKRVEMLLLPVGDGVTLVRKIEE